MFHRIEMNESTKVVAVAYGNNQSDRSRTIYNREQILDAMPIGVPLTAKEICERVAELGVANYYGWSTLKINPQQVVQFVQTMLPYGIVVKEKCSIEPYTIKIPVRHHWENGEWIIDEEKEKIINTIMKYTRLK